MVIYNVFRCNSANSARRQAEAAAPGAFSRTVSAILRQLSRLWCGMHGHLILLHFEPHKLSLQCGLCGYESEGWEVGRPLTARRQANNPQARPERHRTLRSVPSKARLAS
jgi:hypothetical protein